MHKILWDFEIQTDRLIPARRPDLVIINKKLTWHHVNFCSSGRLQSENKRKQKNTQLLGPCQRTEKAVEQESVGDTNCS